MSLRKLKALGFPEQKTFDPNDEANYRSLVVWLEDQKIRQMKIEDRAPLRETGSTQWPQTFNKYISELGCPVPQFDAIGCLEWLISLAVRLEYSDNAENYRAVEANAVKPPAALVRTATSSAAGPSSAGNPLVDLDYQSAEFKAAVTSLQCLLQLPSHPDHLEVLKAISLVVQERLSKDKKPRSEAESGATTATLNLQSIDGGIDTGDYVVNDVVRILRLLHLRELRDLQTRINEAIVAVQALVADPKTDQRLGRIGR